MSARLTATAGLALLLAGCAAKTPPATTAVTPAAAVATPHRVGVADTLDHGPLAREMDPLFAAPALQTAVWSVLVQSLDTGEVLYRLNPDTLVMPASNQKIVTTAVAASRLGWDFTFETRLETAATVDGGVLRGDLIVTGAGDPTVNGREKRIEAFFDEVAAALKAAGISRVEGRIVGDDNAWEDERFGEAWQLDDVAYGYSAPIGALQFNQNLVEVVVTPGASEGAPASVAVRPDGSGLRPVNRVTTAASGGRARIDIARFPGRQDLIVTGTIPLDAKESVESAAVDNPTLFFAAALRLALEARGIAVTGEAVDIDDIADASAGSRRVLARLQSPPLSEFGKTLMKISQNLYAETMMRALSLEPGPATMEASRTMAEETLGRWGIGPGQFVISDGSGLSRMNYVCASTITRILRAVARDPQSFDAFVATLPIAGKDGTIASRMRGTRAEGNVKAKTGTIRNVRSLSGYLTTADGERLTFSMIANNFTVPSSVVDGVVDGALERLSNRTRASVK